MNHIVDKTCLNGLWTQYNLYLEMLWGAKNSTMSAMIEKYLKMNPKAAKEDIEVLIITNI